VPAFRFQGERIPGRPDPAPECRGRGMCRSMKNRAIGERERLEHSIRRLRGQLDALEISVRCAGPISADIGQCLVQGALNIATTIARHDAFDLAEQDAQEDAKPVTCKTCRDTHRMTIHRANGNEDQVPCTRCPRPCVFCRGDLSAYCKKTPCSCDCHKKADR
jgi:hypothetical protein